MPKKFFFQNMTWIRCLCCIFVFWGLSACSGTKPFIDMRREAGQVQPVGFSRPEKPAICFNGWVSDSKEIDMLAEEVCLKSNQNAVFIEEKAFSCRMLTPRIRFYSCKP